MTGVFTTCIHSLYVELSWNKKSARTECTHYDHSFVVIKYHVLSIKVGKIFLNPRLQVISTTTVLCPSMCMPACYGGHTACFTT